MTTSAHPTNERTTALEAEQKKSAPGPSATNEAPEPLTPNLPATSPRDQLVKLSTRPITPYVSCSQDLPCSRMGG